MKKQKNLKWLKKEWNINVNEKNISNFSTAIDFFSQYLLRKPI